MCDTEKIAWVQIPRNVDGMLENYVITEEMTKTPRRIKGLKTDLFQYQRSSLQAMLDLEKRKKITLDAYTVSTTAGLYSDPVGSGKTITILALILANKKMKLIKSIFNISNKKYTYIHRAEVVRRQFKIILNTTLVFVGLPVLKQWVDAIRKYSTLKYFVVSNVFDLKEMIKMITTKEINQYDLILIKNGKITRKVKLPFGLKLNELNRGRRGATSYSAWIYNIIGNINVVCWSRVVLDDYDVIGIPRKSVIINSGFTWFISSTNKIGKNMKTLSFSESDENYENTFIINNIGTNILLKRLINIRCSDDYIKKYNKLIRPIYYNILIKNRDNRIIGLFQNVGEDENILAEMLNSGSRNTAAKYMNMIATEPIHIFEKMLGKKYAEYEFAVNLLSFINSINVDDLDDYPDDNSKYGMKELKNFIPPQHKFPGLKTLLKENDNKYSQIKESLYLAIERIKDNVSDGECLICFEQMAKCDSNVIMKCCSAILCSICAISVISTQQINKHCPKCRTNIKKDGIIIVGFDVNNIFNDDKDDEDDEDDEDDDDDEDNDEDDDEDNEDDDEEDDDEDDEEDDDEEGEDGKINTLIKIIKGEMVTNANMIEKNIDNVQQGADIYIEPPKIKKVLVFSHYAESINNIVRKLTNKNITFFILNGSPSQIKKSITLFEKCKKSSALIIHSVKYCSGLNLQFASDLVFMHKMINPSIETQVIGRILRLGRTFTASIHYILYENENRN